MKLNLNYHCCQELILRVQVPEHLIWVSQNLKFSSAKEVVEAFILEVVQIHLNSTNRNI